MTKNAGQVLSLAAIACAIMLACMTAVPSIAYADSNDAGYTNWGTSNNDFDFYYYWMSNLHTPPQVVADAQTYGGVYQYWDVVYADTNSANRFCMAVARAYGWDEGHPTGQMRKKFFDSASDNTVIYWVPGGNYWYRRSASGYNNYISSLNCSSSDQVTPTFTADKTSIKAGQPVTLNWDMRAGRSGNTTVYMGSTCEASNFTLPTYEVPVYEWTYPECEMVYYDYYPYQEYYCPPSEQVYVGSYTQTAISGSTTVYPAQTTTYTYTCPYNTGVGSRSVTVTVEEEKPDLTASSLAPVSGIAGQLVTFNGSVSNGGSGPASQFSSYVEITNGVTSWTNAVSLATGASASVSSMYAFSNGGNYQARLCADGFGQVSETNEGNNCGGWSSVTIYNATDANLSLSPSSIAYGGSSTINWSATSGASSCTGTGFNTGGATSGAITVSPTVTTSYRIDCTGPGGYDYAIASLTVGAQLFPDLTGSVGPAVAVTAGQEAIFSGSTSNVGSGPAASGFQDLFIFYLADQSTWHGYQYTSPNPEMSSGDSIPRSISYTFASPGTYYYRLCADWGGSVNESNEGNNCSAFQSVTVSAAPAADLTAGTTVVGASPKAGVPVNFSAPATNSGNATSGSFPILFQVAQNGALVNSGYLAGLASGASGWGGAYYAFPDAGNYQVRACANYNTAWTAIVTESDYGNNCGGWTTVSVAPAIPPSVSCTASPTTVPSGGTVTYNASPAGGAFGPYTWVASDGASMGTGSSVTRTVTTPGTYAMNVQASNTSVSYCPNVSVEATWCTGGSGSGTMSITANPTRVQEGQAVALSWTASGISGESATCTVTGPGVSWSSPVSASPACSIPTSSQSPTITTQSTYTLTCGSQSKSVTVNVIPKIIEF